MIQRVSEPPDINGSASLALGQMLNGSSGCGPSEPSSATVPSVPATLYVDFGEKDALGSGHYGDVGKVKAIRDGQLTEEIYACKTLVHLSKKDKAKVSREIGLLKSLKHPYIVEYVDFYLVNDKGDYDPNGSRARLVMECCDGDLATYLDKWTKIQNETNQYTRTLTTKLSVNKSPEENKSVRNSTKSATGLPEPIIWRCLNHIASALFLCHYRRGLPNDGEKPKVSPDRVIHRDVKPPNILTKLTTGKPDEEIVFKLADFGISVEKKTAYTTVIGNFCAPELYFPKCKKLGKVNTKSDVYSLGCVIYYMCQGQDPNEHDDDEDDGNEDEDEDGGEEDDENDDEEDDDDDDGFYWKTDRKRQLLVSEPSSVAYSKELRELMADCVALKPPRRPSIWDILQIIKKKVPD